MLITVNTVIKIFDENEEDRPRCIGAVTSLNVPSLYQQAVDCPVLQWD